MCDVVKIYTAHEVAILLRVDYKTVLNLVRRGKLHALSGIRHKRFIEGEIKRYLGLGDHIVLPEPSALHRPALPVEASSSIRLPPIPNSPTARMRDPKKAGMLAN